MPISVDQTTPETSVTGVSTNTWTFTNQVAPGSDVILFCQMGMTNGQVVSTVTDNAPAPGNTYVREGFIEDPVGAARLFFYRARQVALPSPVSTKLAVTMTTPVTATIQGGCMSFMGLAQSNPEAFSGFQFGGAWAGDRITPAVGITDADLYVASVITSLGSGTMNITTPTGGWTQQFTQNDNTTYHGAAGSYAIGSAPQTCTWNNTTGTPSGLFVLIGCFKAAIGVQPSVTVAF